MARIRCIKPDFWKDHSLATSLSRDARLLYIGMWNFSDDHGVIEGPSERVKAEIFPYESVNIRKLLSELIQSGRLIEYQVGSSTYFYLPKLSKHQKLDRSRASNLPMPSDEIIGNHLKSSEIILGKGKGKGKGKGIGVEGGVGENPSCPDGQAVEATVLSNGKPWGTPDALLDLYNAECPEDCPAAETLSPKRREKAIRILKAFPDKTYWLQAFREVHKSPFLRGRCPPSKGHSKAFTASFDWLLGCSKEGIENIVQVWEGKYGNQA